MDPSQGREASPKHTGSLTLTLCVESLLGRLLSTMSQAMRFSVTLEWLVLVNALEPWALIHRQGFESGIYGSRLGWAGMQWGLGSSWCVSCIVFLRFTL